ncbi:MAG: cytochrome P450 [Shimia sp.]|uniref:cytochrome P450 n=1 Tax=Shimia sp. TaxID=1954381 RepID=UPI003B8E106D
MSHPAPVPDDTKPPLPVHAKLATEPLGLFGSLKAARSNLLSILPELAVRQPMVSGRTGIRWHMVMDPGAIRRILLEKVDDYPKSKATKNILRPAIGDSLFIAEGSHWRWQRRAAAPVFTHRNIANLAPVMAQAAERAATRIADQAPQAVDMMSEMVQTTFDVISEVTFSGDGSFDSSKVHQAIDDYIAEAGKISLLDMLGVPDWVPRPGRMMSGNAVGDMKQVADTAIEARKARGAKDTPDLLDLLLAGVDPETKKTMNTAELRDNLLTFIVAGHETTALTLAWALYLCAFDQDVQEKARAEIADICDDGPITGEQAMQLTFVRQIIDETLRLYPPAGIISRTAQSNDMLCARDIRPGDTVMIPIYTLQRNRLLWDDPDAFKPERFADRKVIDRYAYLPFGDGPRICIGASFAIQEAVIVLATLLNRFRFDLVEGKPPKPVMILTLRPEGGVWLQATPLT